MYRMMTNEKVASSAASAPAVTTRVTATAAIADFARTVVTSLSRAFNRASIAHELALLDNRVLADIGVKRTEINYVAEQATQVSGELTVFQAFSRMVFSLTVQPVLLYLHRRHVHDTLSALDNRMLADIGLSRYEISDYVRTLQRHDTAQVPALLAATERDLVAPLRVWNRARATARQLSKLDDRMLVDIGVVRGDIDWLAGEIARKTLAPANRVAANDHSPRAA